MKRLTWLATSFLASMALSCVTAENVPEDCQNGLDDNRDDAVDCQDEQCVGTPECTEVCNNGLDEDVDGVADCADSDCAGALNCILLSEVCNNGIDDDGDTKIDCQDDSCVTAANCTQNFGEICNNTDDDDGDGLIDCQDPNCATAPNCVPPENCNNGADDDLDGQVDCQDPQCSTAANCVQNPAEICTGGVDEDGDTKIDCQDTDCTNNAACVAPSCDPANDQCTNNDICIGSSCVGAFGRQYTISTITASLDSTDATGADWDFGSSPDIQVEVFLNDTSILTTAEITNPLVNGRFTADFTESVSRTINSGDKLTLVARDNDLNANDIAITCNANPVPAAILRQRIDISCVTADGVTAILFFNITPN